MSQRTSEGSLAQCLALQNLSTVPCLCCPCQMLIIPFWLSSFQMESKTSTTKLLHFYFSFYYFYIWMVLSSHKFSTYSAKEYFFPSLHKQTCKFIPDIFNALLQVGNLLLCPPPPPLLFFFSPESNLTQRRKDLNMSVIWFPSVQCSWFQTHQRMLHLEKSSWLISFLQHCVLKLKRKVFICLLQIILRL